MTSANYKPKGGRTTLACPFLLPHRSVDKIPSVPINYFNVAKKVSLKRYTWNNMENTG